MTREPEFSEQPGPQMLGRKMVTNHGEVIGRVSDVLFDETDSDGAWAVVGTGLLRSERFVPLTAAYVATDGNVVVPYDKNTVKHAPRPDDHHVLSRTVRQELAEYYGAA